MAFIFSSIIVLIAGVFIGIKITLTGSITGVVPPIDEGARVGFAIVGTSQVSKEE